MSKPEEIYSYSGSDLQTGIDWLDGLSEFIAFAGMQKGWSLAEARGFVAIWHNETRNGDPRTIGDIHASGGPSIGRGQVYRATAKAYGLWNWDGEGDERQAYASLVSDEARTSQMSVDVFDRKLSENNHNLPLSIERYNGSGPDARNYRDRALSFISETWR